MMNRHQHLIIRTNTKQLCLCLFNICRPCRHPRLHLCFTLHTFIGSRKWFLLQLLLFPNPNRLSSVPVLDVYCENNILLCLYRWRLGWLWPDGWRRLLVVSCVCRAQMMLGLLCFGFICASHSTVEKKRRFELICKFFEWIKNVLSHTWRTGTWMYFFEAALCNRHFYKQIRNKQLFCRWRWVCWYFKIKI